MISLHRRTRNSSTMRVAAIFGVLGLASICAFAQTAYFDFNNTRTFTMPADRRVYLDYVGGTKLIGTNYVAQLYYGSDANSLNSVTSNPVQFRNVAVTNLLAGTWSGRTAILTGFSPGDTVTLQVRAWDRNSGATWDAARLAGGRYGQSATFTWRVTVAGGDHEEDLENFRGFALMTNPPARTLVIRENGERVDLLYSGTHTIQGASSLSGPWVTLATSSAPYTDPASGTNQQRFYRMRDEPGPTYSLNAVGYYRREVCAGFSLIANQLNADGGNTVVNVLKTPPERTEIYKYNQASGGYASISYLGGAWEGDNLEMTLNPGEGVFLYSPAAYTHRFLGEVPQIGSVSITPGWNILSCPLPITGPVDQRPPNGLNFPVQSGDCFYPFRCTSAYAIDCYFAPFWEGDSGGHAPIVAIGESFFYRSTRAFSWNVEHCLTCP
jgi:hypothetical protein